MSNRKPTHGEVEAARFIAVIMTMLAIAWIVYAVIVAVNFTPDGRLSTVEFLALTTLAGLVVVGGSAAVTGIGYLGFWCWWALTTPPAGKPGPVEEV